MKIFPESALKPLQKLLWLSLDNNKIEEIRLGGRRQPDKEEGRKAYLRINRGKGERK
jgi:hypothetical protein